MENNFDKSIKKMLENFEEEFKPSDWNLMEEKIEEHSELHPDLEDALLDGMVYDSLHDLEDPYNPEHWNLMREKLDGAYAFRRKLMKYKVVEVALVLLFIITSIQYLPVKNLQLRKIARTDQSVKAASELSDPTTSITAPDEQSIADEGNVANLATSPAQNTMQESAAISDNTITYSSDSETLVTEEVKETSSYLAENNLNNQQAPEVAPNENSTTPTEIVIEDMIEEAAYDTDLLNPLLLKAEEPFAIPGIEEINSSKVFSDLKQPIRVRIGMSLGADVNYIITPEDEINVDGKFLPLEEVQRLRPGYSGGFTLGFQYDKWEIETNALYSAITYDPRRVTYLNGSIDGYVNREFKSARLDIIRLPVNLKYNFFTKKKWNVYVYSGVSLNLLAKTFYDFAVTDAGAESDGASRNYLADPRFRQEEEQRYDRNGIFEGGQFSDNTFISANLGFGIERYFTPRMSIFLQPNYQHQFSKSLGPQNDKIHSLSIMTGAKVTLQKRKKSKR